MEGIMKFLVGKKTHMLVFLYVLLTMFTGEDSAGVLENLNMESLKDALPVLMLSTLKAAWDRKNPA